MKILVTGGAGFIGSNVVDGYIAKGHTVVVIDNLFTGKKENVNPAATFYEVDIRSPSIKKIIEKERPEVINHPGKGTNTLDLFQIIFEEVKKVETDLDEKLRELKRESARPGDITKSCLVVEKASSKLGWSPETSLSLTEGTRATIEWYQRSS